jgi:hypothetical protein
MSTVNRYQPKKKKKEWLSHATYSAPSSITQTSAGPRPIHRVLRQICQVASTQTGPCMTTRTHERRARPGHH